LLDGAHVVMAGDLKYGRTVHSLIKLLALYRGMKFTLVSPPGLEMPDYVLEQVSRNDHVIEQTHNLAQGLKGADVIYATRVQKERFTGEQMEGYSEEFQVNKAIVDASCGPDVVIMHPLPRDSREGAHDLSTDLNHDSRLAIFRQTDNGIPVRMAIFAVLLGVENLVQHSLRDVTWLPPSHIGPDDSVFHGID
jgi:aspartate carbamoyltransferase catalytic subunit